MGGKSSKRGKSSRLNTYDAYATATPRRAPIQIEGNPSKSTNSPRSTPVHEGTSKPNTFATRTTPLVQPGEAGVPRTLHTGTSLNQTSTSLSTHSVVKPSPSTSKTPSETGKGTQRTSYSNTSNKEKSANSLYIKLQEKIGDVDFKMIKNRLQGSPIPLNRCEKEDSFFNICCILQSMGKLKPHENDFNYLISLFDGLRLGELKQMVEAHMKKQKKADGNTQDLYNMEAELKSYEVQDVVDVLKHYSLGKKGENPQAIPQRICYINAAVGIAREDRDSTIRLGGDDVILTVPEDALETPEIISCYYVEESISSRLDIDCCQFSIPVKLGPSKQDFKEPVMLSIKHNAVIDPASFDNKGLKLYIFDDDQSPPRWRKIKGTNQLKTDSVTVNLHHFSTFVVAIDRNVTSSLPLLKTRIFTATTKPNQQGYSSQKIIICIVFDNNFTIKKSKRIVKEEFGVELDVSNNQTLLLKPFTQGEIEVRSGLQVNKAPALSISVEDVQNLISAPIIHSAELVSEQQKLQNTCKVVVTQEDMCQKFEVSVDDFRFVKKMFKPDTKMTHREELTCGELDHATGASTSQENHDSPATWLYDGITKKITELIQEMHDESLQINNRIREEHQLELGRQLSVFENILQSVKSQVSIIIQEYIEQIKTKNSDLSELQNENKRMSEKLTEVTKLHDQEKYELKLQVQSKMELEHRFPLEEQLSFSEYDSESKEELHEEYLTESKPFDIPKCMRESTSQLFFMFLHKNREVSQLRLENESLKEVLLSYTV